MILKSSKEAECPEELMWEKMLDIAGLDDGFPVIGLEKIRLEIISIVSLRGMLVNL